MQKVIKAFKFAKFRVNISVVKKTTEFEIQRLFVMRETNTCFSKRAAVEM